MIVHHNSLMKLVLVIPWLLSPKALGQDNPSKEEAALRQFIQDFEHEKKLPRDGDEQFSYALLDLNDDGRDEAILYLIGRSWCGTGGCPTFILKQRDNKYSLISKISITRPPIWVLDATSYLWHNLAFLAAGGSYEVRPAEVEVFFDGHEYPPFPSIPPGRQLKEGSPGKVVITKSSTLVPVYPKQR